MTFKIGSRRLRRPLALLAAVLVPAALAAPGSASAQSLPVYHIECEPPFLFPLAPPATVDDTNTSRIAYRQTWKAEAPRRGQYMGTQHVSNYGGATATFVLPSGAYQFAFGFTKFRSGGKAALYHNNQWFATIDTYSETERNCAVIYMTGEGEAGPFMVKVLNQRNPASRGTYVGVDYFHFES